MKTQYTPGPLRRAQGLGSAKKGVAHWLTQRVTAVALVPLGLWFVASLIGHIRGGYSALIAWLAAPPTSILMMLLLIALFYHTALGLEVVIGDYVHVPSVKFAALLAMRLACFTLTIIGLFAVLRIALHA
jgi:succinate dehydrogenase / fumarate reductase membrane anchor subunit